MSNTSNIAGAQSNLHDIAVKAGDLDGLYPSVQKLLSKMDTIKLADSIVNNYAECCRRKGSGEWTSKLLAELLGLNNGNKIDVSLEQVKYILSRFDGYMYNITGMITEFIIISNESGKSMDESWDINNKVLYSDVTGKWQNVIRLIDDDSLSWLRRVLAQDSSFRLELTDKNMRMFAYDANGLVYPKDEWDKRVDKLITYNCDDMGKNKIGYKVSLIDDVSLGILSTAPFNAFDAVFHKRILEFNTMIQDTHTSFTGSWMLATYLFNPSELREILRALMPSRGLPMKISVEDFMYSASLRADDIGAMVQAKEEYYGSRGFHGIEIH